jgi:hypothetical protein
MFLRMAETHSLALLSSLVVGVTMKTYAVVKHNDQWGICIAGSYTMIFDSYREAVDTAMMAAEILRDASKRATPRFMDAVSADIAESLQAF